MRKPRFVRFLDLKQSDLNCDFHVHTDRTDGSCSIEEVLEEAVKRGLDRIAFTEHVRQDTGWFPEFESEIQTARRKFSTINVFIGCETKTINERGSLDLSDDVRSRCDIVLGSVHRFPDGAGGFIDFKTLSQKKMAEIEVNLSIGLLEYATIDVLAHPGSMYYRQFSFDLPQHLMTKILEISLKRKIAVEINSSYIRDFRSFLKLCSQINPYVSIGSDMHELKQLGACRDRLIANGLGGNT